MIRKKEDFDNLADTVIAMPVGEMEKSIQEYLETQVFYISFIHPLDGYISWEYPRFI